MEQSSESVNAGVTRADLEACVERAIERRLQASGKIARDGPRGPLLGYCFSNAVVLQSVLDERGIEGRLVGGARAYDLPEEWESGDEPETAEALSTGIPLHYWVEVESPGETFVVELATEVRPHRGEPAVYAGLPDAFVRYLDSYSYPREVLAELEAEAGLCSSCGDIPQADMGAASEKVCACGREFTVDG